MTAALAERLALIVIADPSATDGRDMVEVTRAALRGGAPAVQLRAKEAATREMVELARRLRAATAEAGALLFVNDRVDVALVCEADGAHIGADDLPLEAARRICPPGFLLGRSVDSAAEAEAARRAGADYLGAGPLAATRSKLDAGPVLGVEGIGAIARSVGIPVVAIGGIDADAAEAAARVGAAGVAVIRAVMQATDPAAAAAGLLRAVGVGRAG